MKLKHVSSVCKKLFYCFLTPKIQFYSKEHKDFPADETQTSTSETPLTASFLRLQASVGCLW